MVFQLLFFFGGGHGVSVCGFPVGLSDLPVHLRPSWPRFHFHPTGEFPSSAGRLCQRAEAVPLTLVNHSFTASFTASTPSCSCRSGTRKIRRKCDYLMSRKDISSKLKEHKPPFCLKSLARKVMTHIRRSCDQETKCREDFFSQGSRSWFFLAGFQA